METDVPSEARCPRWRRQLTFFHHHRSLLSAIRSASQSTSTSPSNSSLPSPSHLRLQTFITPCHARYFLLPAFSPPKLRQRTRRPTLMLFFPCSTIVLQPTSRPHPPCCAKLARLPLRDFRLSRDVFVAPEPASARCAPHAVLVQARRTAPSNETPKLVPIPSMLRSLCCALATIHDLHQSSTASVAVARRGCATYCVRRPPPSSSARPSARPSRSIGSDSPFFSSCARSPRPAPEAHERD